MPHVSNFTQGANKIVLDLINANNGLSLVESAVHIDLTSTQAPVVMNTQAEITAAAGSGYSGSVVVEYNRLDIAGFVDLYYPDGFVIPLGDSVSLNDVIPEINAGLGINLVEDLDFANEPIEEWEGIPNETKEMMVDILTSSKVYMGVLTFTLDGNGIPLNSVITTTVLSGLNLPSGEVVEPPAVLYYTRTDDFKMMFEGDNTFIFTRAAGAVKFYDDNGAVIAGTTLNLASSLYDSSNLILAIDYPEDAPVGSPINEGFFKITFDGVDYRWETALIVLNTSAGVTRATVTVAPSSALETALLAGDGKDLSFDFAIH